MDAVDVLAQSNTAVNDIEEFAAANFLGLLVTPSDHLLKEQLPKPLTLTEYVWPLLVGKLLVVNPVDATFPLESYRTVYSPKIDFPPLSADFTVRLDDLEASHA